MTGRQNAWSRFLADERGSITVEFLIWVPILAFWILLSVALYDGYMTRNQTAKVTHTISDVLSRHEAFSQAQFDEIRDLQQVLLTRARLGTDLRVSSIQLIGGNLEVRWSKTSPGLPALTTAEIPITQIPAMAELDSIILTEVFVPWAPLADLLGLEAHTWTFRISNRPRFVSKIQLSDV